MQGFNFNKYQKLMIPIREEENLGSQTNRIDDSSNRFTRTNTNPQNFWQQFEAFITKRAKVMSVFIIISVIFGIVITAALVKNYLTLSALREQNIAQASKLQDMKMEMQNSLDKYQKNFKNLTQNFQKIRREVYGVKLEAYRSQNQVQNLFGLTRREKFAIDQKIDDFSNIFETSRNKYVQQINNIHYNANPSPPIPKILWFYTEFNFQAQKMVTQMFGNFILEKAKQQGFEIRMATSWSAYEWLSPETTAKITKAMQNNKFQQRVGDLLRLGLLMEHGGMILKIQECFLVNDFKWVHNYLKFDANSNLNINNEVFLFSESSESSPKPLVQDYFIAAIKNSKLIAETFDILSETLEIGKSKLKDLRDAVITDQEVGSSIIPNITKTIIQSLFRVMTPEYYSAKIVNVDITLFLTSYCRDNLGWHLKRPSNEYISKCGQPSHIVHVNEGNDRAKIEEELDYEILTSNLGADREGYWHTLMVIQANRKLFDPLPPRPIHFCIIDAHPDNEHQSLINSFQKLKLQKFKKFTAVYFVKSDVQQNNKYAKQQSDQGFPLILPVHTGSIGRNYQVGIIKHCPAKSVVIVLRRNEGINDVEALQVLSQAMTPRNILGAFVGLNISGQVKQSKDVYPNYNKVEYNSRQPKYQDLSAILNHLRVFHSDCYKIIPQFDLRTPEGQYFNDRFIFLQQFLQMVREMRDKHDYTEIPHTQKVNWYIKSNSHIFDVPNKIAAAHNVLISTFAYEQVNKEQLKLTFYRMDSFAMTYNMDHLLQSGIPMSEFAVFNPANQYEPYTIRNKPQLIPKVFHLVWIDGEMPETKKKVLEINKGIYPDFEFKVWSKENITKERFPLSYDLLHNIYNMENSSRYSKRATMADVFRHEVMYNEGGIYMDTSMILFNKGIEKFLSYKLALSTQRTFRHRWAQSMCIFAVMPKFPGLLRIISHNNTNRYNLWLRDALQIAGPHNFRWLVRGMQQYDPDYLIMNYDAFYPMTYSLINYFETYCFIQPSYLSSQDKVILKYKDRNMISNCGKYYPYSFGKEMNSIGSSWQNPKW